MRARLSAIDYTTAESQQQLARLRQTLQRAGYGETGTTEPGTAPGSAPRLTPDERMMRAAIATYLGAGQIPADAAQLQTRFNQVMTQLRTMPDARPRLGPPNAQGVQLPLRRLDGTPTPAPANITHEPASRARPRQSGSGRGSPGEYGAVGQTAQQVAQQRARVQGLHKLLTDPGVTAAERTQILQSLGVDPATMQRLQALPHDQLQRHLVDWMRTPGALAAAGITDQAGLDRLNQMLGWQEGQPRPFSLQDGSLSIRGSGEGAVPHTIPWEAGPRPPEVVGQRPGYGAPTLG